MATVHVILRTSAANKQGKCPLRIQLIHERQKKEITLPGARIHPSKWDAENLLVLGDDMLTLRVENEMLKYRSAINKMHALGIPIDLDEVVASVRGKKIVTTKAERLTDYIKEHFESSPALAYSTKKNYTSCRKHIEGFSPQIKLNQVNVKWMHEYAAWLREKYNLADWTMHTRMKIVKRVMKHAYEQGVIQKVDLSGYKLKTGNATKEFVSMEELRLLRGHTPARAGDQGVLRAFLFSCFAGGLRFGDLATLRYSAITSTSASSDSPEYRLTYTMRKTGRQVTFTLNKHALAQLDLDKVGSQELVFGLLKQSDLRLPKDELSKRIESRNAYCNQRLKVVLLEAGVKRDFSFHCARHTFFCLGLQLGVDLMSLKELGGHADIKITQGYLKLIDEQKRLAMAKFDEI